MEPNNSPLRICGTRKNILSNHAEVTIYFSRPVSEKELCEFTKFIIDEYEGRADSASNTPD